jgi:hypothetical protein
MAACHNRTEPPGLCSGVFDACPKAKSILGHLGELLPFSMERFERGWQFYAAHKAKHPINFYMQSNLWISTSGNVSAASLAGALASPGAARILSTSVRRATREGASPILQQRILRSQQSAPGGAPVRTVGCHPAPRADRRRLTGRCCWAEMRCPVGRVPASRGGGRGSPKCCARHPVLLAGAARSVRPAWSGRVRQRCPPSATCTG